MVVGCDDSFVLSTCLVGSLTSCNPTVLEIPSFDCDLSWLVNHRTSNSVVIDQSSPHDGDDDDGDDEDDSADSYDRCTPDDGSVLFRDCCCRTPSRDADASIASINRTLVTSSARTSVNHQ